MSDPIVKNAIEQTRQTAYFQGKQDKESQLMPIIEELRNEVKDITESRDGHALDANRYRDEMKQRTEDAFLAGYSRGHADATEDAEKHGHASYSKDDEIEALEQWRAIVGKFTDQSETG